MKIEPDWSLSDELAGRNGVIYFWQMLPNSPDGPLWGQSQAYAASPAGNPAFVYLLISYLGNHEWVSVARADIIKCK